MQQSLRFWNWLKKKEWCHFNCKVFPQWSFPCVFCVSLSVYLCYTHSLFLSFTCTTARCMNSSHLALWNVKRILWCHWMYSQGGIDKLMTTQPLFAPQTSWTGRKVTVLFWVCLPAVSSVMCGVLGCGISSVFYACVVPHTQDHQHGKPSDTYLYMKWSLHKGRMKYWEELNLFMEIKKTQIGLNLNLREASGTWRQYAYFIFLSFLYWAPGLSCRYWLNGHGQWRPAAWGGWHCENLVELATHH